jgi:hypothetical protein
MPAFEEAESKIIYGTSTAGQYGKFSTYLGHSAKVSLFDFKFEMLADSKAVLNPLASMELEGEEIKIAGMSAEATRLEKYEKKEQSVHQFRSLSIAGTTAARVAPDYQLLVQPAVAARVAAASAEIAACMAGEVAILSATALEAEGVSSLEDLGIGAAAVVGTMALVYGGSRAVSQLQPQPPTGKFSLQCDNGSITAGTSKVTSAQYKVKSDLGTNLQTGTGLSGIYINQQGLGVRSATISLTTFGGFNFKIKSTGVVLEGGSMNFTFDETEIG